MSKKRILAGLLAAALFFAAVPLPVFARAAGNTSNEIDLLQDNLSKVTITPEKNMFSSLKLSASWTDGKTLKMRFDVALANDALQEWSGGYENADFAEAAQQEIAFTVPFSLGDALSCPNKIEGVCETTLEGEAAPTAIANYSIERSAANEESEWVLQCTFISKNIWSKQGITAGQEFKLNIDKDNIESVTPSLAEKDGKVEVSVEIKEKPTAGGVDGLDYKLEKALTSREPADPKFEYTITATAEATKQDGSQEKPRLNGLTIRDTLPEGLVLDSVKLDDEPLEADHYTYGSETREFSYKVTPEYNESEPDSAVPNVKLTLTAYVDTKTYKAYINNQTGEYKKTFTNQAALYDGEHTKPLAKSVEVTDTLSGPFFSKDGKVSGDTGGVYEWTLKAHTRFSAIESAYIIDMIPDTKVHMYKNSSEDFSYTINGSKVTPNKIESDTAYNDVTPEKANELASSGAVYYETKGQAILIIPIGDYVNTPLVVTYQTEIQSTQTNLKNTAKIVWQEAHYGPGPGEIPEYTYEMEKEITANLSDIQKTGGAYDERTQELTWNFEINHKGVEMEDVVITDTLDDSKQKLVSIKTPDGSDIPSTNTSDVPYYTVKENKDAHTHTYEIHLGDIAASTLYKFSLTTKVVDPAVLSVQDNSAVTNNAEMAYGHENGRTTTEVKGETNIPNTLITKTAVGSYDFTDHTLKWKITINPNSLTIKDAELTDLLPEGNTFLSLDAVARGTTDASGSLTAGVEKATIVNNSNGCSFKFGDEPDITCNNATEKNDKGYSKDTTTFKLSDISKAYVFELTTTVDQNYRDAILRDLKPHTVTNEAKLTGKIENKVAGQSGGIINAEATADNTITAPPVAKTGVYHKDGASQYPTFGKIDYITWTLVVNPDGVDMSGATIKDELHEWFELDTLSLQIYEAVIDDAGTAKQGKAISDPPGLTTNEKGFTYEIPENLSRQPLLLTFNTLVTDTAAAKDMNNTVSLAWRGGGEIKTPVADAKEAEGFDLANYATASPAPLLRIKKVSANSDALPLSGAVFTLTKMKQENGAWVDDTPKSKTTSARKGVEGTASFLFLTANTLYKLEETAAPAGYKTAAPQYFVFGGTQGQAQYPENTTMLEANVAAYAEVYTIRDTPTGSLQFQKCVANSDGTAGAPLPNIGFTLTLDDPKVEPQIQRTATSDADGKVLFTALDPGTYTLTEDGKKDLSWAVTVTEGQKTSITADATVPLIGTAEGGYTITNTVDQAQFGTVKGKKTTSSGAPLAGAVLGLFKEGKTLAAYKATSGDDGTFTFSLVKPGDYTLREISAPAGYDLNDKTEFTVTVAADKQTVKDIADADIVIRNERTQTNTGGGGGGSSNGRLTIEKTSDDGAKQGFTFRIKGSGYDKTFVTNAAGKIELAALATGTYTVTEEETGATEQYILPEGQTVKLTSKGATLAFHNKRKPEVLPVDPADPNDPNKPVDPNNPNSPADPNQPNKPDDPGHPGTPGKPGVPGTDMDADGTPKSAMEGGANGGKTLLSPKTGYRSPLTLWLALALLSAAGFALCAGQLRGKRYRGRHQRR